MSSLYISRCTNNSFLSRSLLTLWLFTLTILILTINAIRFVKARNHFINMKRLSITILILLLLSIAPNMCISFIHIGLLYQWLWHQPVDVSSLRFYHVKIFVYFRFTFHYLPYHVLIVSLVYWFSHVLTHTILLLNHIKCTFHSCNPHILNLEEIRLIPIQPPSL